MSKIKPMLDIYNLTSKINVVCRIVKHIQWYLKLKYNSILCIKKYNIKVCRKKFDHYEVPPEKIKYKVGGKLYKKYGFDRRYPPQPVLDGDWSEIIMDFEKSGTYQSLNDRFIHNKAWEQTEYYIKLINEKKYNHNQAINYLNKYDEIYNDMKYNGYKKNKPIKVYIGSSGEYLLASGKHRLSLAKILELQEIPIKVWARHQEWQQLRCEINKNNPPREKNILSHPDIEPILN